MHAGKLISNLASWAYALVLCAPVAVWLVSVGNPMDYFTHSVPPGQLLFVLSKLAALLALFAFWVQCMLGLAQRTPLLRDLPTIKRKNHGRMGMLTAGLALAHVTLFVVATSYRTGKPAWNLLLPNFDHGYYNTMVSLGLFAVWLLLVGVFAGWRASRGRRAWRAVHMVWPLVFALVFVHAFAIGSESRFGVMRYLFLFVAVSLSAAAVSRVRGAWGRKKTVDPAFVREGR